MRSWKRLGYADRRLSVDRGQLNAWKRPQPEQSKLLVQNGKNAETVSWECSVVCVDNPLVSLNALRKRPEASQNGGFKFLCGSPLSQTQTWKGRTYLGERMCQYYS